MSNSDIHGADEPGPGGQPDTDSGPLLAVDEGANVIALSWQRVRRALPAVVGRCMAFSAKTRFDPSLVAAVNRFYGLEVDVATAESEILEDDDERVRFFPWFLWDWRTDPGASTVGEEFLREAGVEEDVRAIAAALTQSYIGFYEVLARTSDEVELCDLATGEVVCSPDRALAEDVSVGEILQARVVRVDATAPTPVEPQEGSPERAPSSPIIFIDALYVVLPPSARPTVALELDSVLTGVDDVTEQMKLAAPELLDFADHLIDDLSQPTPALNSDGEELALCSTVLLGPHGEHLRQALPRIDAATEEAAVPGLWTWRRGARALGLVDATRADRVTLLANSPRRWRALLESVGKSLRRPLGRQLGSIEDFDVAADRWLEGLISGPWLVADAEIRAAFRSRVDGWLRAWPDTPRAKLAYRSPREAVRNGGQKEVRAELERIEEILRTLSLESGADDLGLIRSELGLQVAVAGASVRA